jgi:branched-chain amino acid transport system ATP-binding protein
MLLEVRDLHAGYGASRVLFGVSLSIEAGEAAALMGRNGMGKTTFVRCVMGLLRGGSGEIRLDGERIERLSPHAIAKRGVGLVPEGRRIFPNLTVRENLLMAAIRRAGNTPLWTLDRVLAFFPRLAERLSNGGMQLSGGEQQMLAIGRALMTNPRLLVLDEATEGLAPAIREEIWTRLRDLRETGLSILVIDKDIEALTILADRHYVIEKGEIMWSGDSRALVSNSRVRERYLGI